MCLVATLVLYFANKRIYRSFRKFLLIPLFFTPLLLLIFGHISYQNYMGEAHWHLWLLGGRYHGHRGGGDQFGVAGTPVYAFG